MPHPAELPEESIAGRASPANDPTVIHAELPSTLDFEDDTGPARTPLRFGRLALWMASASALGIGVLGTVGYSMWFTHDQRVYAEAMASARKTLGIEQPALALTQSAGSVEAAGAHRSTLANSTPLPDGTTTPDTVALADNTPATDPPDAPATTANDGSTSGAGAGVAAAAIGAAQNANSAATQTADDSTNARAAQPAAARKVANRSTRSSQQLASQAARRRSAHAKAEQPGLFARMGAFFHRVSYQQRNVPTRQREEYSRP